MPTISLFYGLLIQMYFFDDNRHNCPYIHVEYAEDTASIAIITGDVLAGSIPACKTEIGSSMDRNPQRRSDGQLEACCRWC